MLTVMNELTVGVSHRAVFEQNFAASMHSTLPGVPGLLRATLLRPNQDGRGYLAILEFDDETAYAAYRSSSAFHNAHHKLRPAFADSSRLITYQTVTEAAH